MSLAILFQFLCAQHVSDINISIIRSLQLCCWITSIVVFSVHCVLEIWCGWVWVVTVLQAEVQISNTQQTENTTANVVIQQQSRKLLMRDILMSETCWAHKKWNKIANDIMLVFYSSTITMMHGPINTRSTITTSCEITSLLPCVVTKARKSCINYIEYKFQAFNALAWVNERINVLHNAWWVLQLFKFSCIQVVVNSQLEVWMGPTCSL